MRFVIVFMLAATADFLWAGYISAVSGKQALRAAAWSMAIAIVSGVIAINYVHAPVLLVSLAAGSFVGTYVSVVSESGKAIRDHLWFSEKRLPVRFAPTELVKEDEGPPSVRAGLRPLSPAWIRTTSRFQTEREGPSETGRGAANLVASAIRCRSDGASVE